MYSFDEAEAVVRDILLTVIAGSPFSGAPVSTQFSEKDIDTSVRIRRVGGAGSELRDKPLVAIEAWSKRASSASKLAGLLRYAMLRAGRNPSGALASCLEVAGPTYLFDPDRNQARYSFTVELTLPIRKD